jgi:chromosome segregation ATPase
LSEAVLGRLKLERDQLQQSARLLADRDRELTQARQQLARLEAAQAQTTAREQQLSAHAERIRDLETRLAQQGANRPSQPELERINRERAELAAQVDSLRAALAGERAQQTEMAELRSRLGRYDQQQAELSTYKNRLAEAEKRLKDAAASVVKDAAYVAPAL